jgi:glutamate dehydrogenase (NADP+)
MALKRAERAKREVTKFMSGLRARNPGEPEFHQAVQEVVQSLMPYVLANRNYQSAQILERITEPDRVVIFRVTWEGDDGSVHVNRAWRVQFNNAIGPYKGGLRFHPSVTLGTLKFLGFEQCFKNALTTLPMGGAKGGSNFDPKGKTDREVMRFCQAFMTEMYRHIGEDTDVPAGDIGVGAREISYLFGQYKRLANRFTGVLTGKGLAFGGSLIRTEATGYGAVYFMENMLEHRGDSVAGKRAVVSGSGNVSLYCIEKLLQLGAKVVTASDSTGFVFDAEGFTRKKLNWLKGLKEVRRGRISEYAERFDGVEYYPGEKPWGVPCDLAFPCATQNEIDGNDARRLVKNGVISVSEGANMPTTLKGVHHFLRKKVLFGPGKAANAGGVSVSGLEQSQNALRIYWSREEVDNRLRDIMRKIHEQCVRYGRNPDGTVDYVRGANVGGFTKLADAMLAYGVV